MLFDLSALNVRAMRKYLWNPEASGWNAAYLDKRFPLMLENNAKVALIPIIYQETACLFSHEIKLKNFIDLSYYYTEAFLQITGKVQSFPVIYFI